MIDAHAASSRFLLGSGDHPIPVVVRPIGAPIDEVWRAWTEPDGLVRWLGAAESPVTGVGVPVPLNMMATQMASGLGSRAVLTPQVVEPPAEKSGCSSRSRTPPIPAAPCSCCCATTASRLTW